MDKLEALMQRDAAQGQGENQAPAEQDEAAELAQEEAPQLPEFPYAPTGQDSIYEGHGGVPLDQPSEPIPGMGVEMYRSLPDEPEEELEETQDMTEPV
jgi:hypothetical protein